MRLSDQDEAFMVAWLAEDAERRPRYQTAETQPANGTDAAGRAAEAYWWWIPKVDANGHELGAGSTNLVFIMCINCPATKDGRGHYVARCRIDGCDAPSITPPGHIGPVQQQH
jgi:hypothetical protein